MKHGIIYHMINLSLTADYISVFLLLFAGIVNLRIKKALVYYVVLGVYLLYNVEHLFGEWMLKTRKS